MPAANDLIAHLLHRLHQVWASLGLEVLPDDPQLRFAEALDSMGLVEFVALLAGDCAVSAEAIEKAAGHRFTTVADLAACLTAAGMRTVPGPGAMPALAQPDAQFPRNPTTAWLAATSVCLPATRQPACVLDALLGRPPGWLEQHAGIASRCVWTGEDVLDRAAHAGRGVALGRCAVPGCVAATNPGAGAPGTIAPTPGPLHRFGWRLFCHLCRVDRL